MSNNKNPDNGTFRNNHELTAMLDFVSHVNKIDSIEEAAWHIVHHTIQSLNFEDCVIYLLDDSKNTLTQFAAYGPKNPNHRKIINPIELKIGQGVVGIAAAECRTIKIVDTRLEANYIVDDQPRLSELAVPIHFRNKVLGVIDSEHKEANFYTDSHRQYIEILGHVLAAKITFNSNICELEKSYSALEKTKMLSDTFLQISELTYSSTTISDFYLGLQNIVVNKVNTHSFSILLFNTETLKYSCPYLHDKDKGGTFDANINSKKMSETLIAEVIHAQSPRLVNFEELQKRKREGRIVDHASTTYSWLAVPFQINQTMQGAVTLQSNDPKIIFNQSDKELLTFLGQHISTAIDQKLQDQKLQYQALHDSATGLASRSLFLNRLEHAFERANRTKNSDIAVLFIDFDDFKSINDNFGHQAGDDVLRVAAERMLGQLRSSDTLARIGGDEYAILLENLVNDSMTMTVSQRILEVMKVPINTQKQSILVSVSIGVCLKDEKVKTFEDLLKNADHAMYHAKSHGKNNIQVYEASLHRSIMSARKKLHELKVAIKEQQLFFYYQPIVDLSSNEVVGFEALMRWQHPEKGLINPNEFIHIAEQNDLIKEIDSQLFDSIAKQLVYWNSITKSHFYISVNISAQRFVDSKLITEIESILRKYKLPKNSIVIEVTEHVLIKNLAKARKLFHQIKSFGIKISLDDFGTGYSSLSYIHQLPFDVIKIDRSFVSHINEADHEHPIISIIVSLAKTLNIKLVAEGIETAKQLDRLKILNCDFGQGFYLSEPVPAHEATQFVKSPKIL